MNEQLKQLIRPNDFILHKPVMERGINMNINEQVDKINNFFDNLTPEEFIEMMEKCGAEKYEGINDKCMIVLVGESSSGKSSIEKNLVEKYGYKKLISYTTRPPRANEQNGIDYHFIDDIKFLHMQQQGLFAEIAEYNGWKYGSAKEDYTNNKVVVLTPYGLRQIKTIKEINMITFYIYVPRRDRLIKILQRGDNIEEAYRRSLSDVGQFDGIEDEVDYVIENKSYEKDVDEMTREILNEVTKEKMLQEQWG